MVKAALHVAGELVDIAAFAPQVPAGGKPVDAIWFELAKSLRNAVFHGKSGESALIPQLGADRARLLEARSRYAAMYLAMAGARLYGAEIAPGGSSLAEVLRRQVLEDLHSGIRVGITSDCSPFDSAEERLSPRLESCEFADVEPVHVAGYQGFQCSRARFSRDQLRRVQTVGRFGSVGEDHQLKLFDSLGGSLDLADLEGLDVIIAQDLKGRPGLRDDFSS